jgi:hypothetical protein
VNSYLHDTVFKCSWYNVPLLKELWRQHLDKERNVEQIIYRAITAEQWLHSLERTT